MCYLIIAWHCCFISGTVESYSDCFVGELPAELGVKETRGAAEQDKRCCEGGRGPAATSTEHCPSTKNQVHVPVSVLYTCMSQM